MKRFLIKNMGCKSNQFEGAIMRENLLKNGYIEAKNIDEADYFILNSCTVTHKSDNEAFYILRNAKHEKLNITNVLTGCIASVEREKLLENEFIDIVIGNDEKLDVAEYLSEKFANADIMSLSEFHYVELSDMTKTRASLKIQDGCDNRCAYCIIPFARGKSRSAKIDFIIEQIKKFEEHGFKEIVFTGIHIGQWGKDFNLKLIDLLMAVEEKTHTRYRLGSLNPLEIDEELLEFLSKSKLFCPHFHLSLQSACDNTLRRMNRFYKTEDYLKQIHKINELFENPFLGSDIIAGFVGETEDDFSASLENLERSELSKIHTFPYSIRRGTVAENLEGHLTQVEKDKRANEIKKISAKKYSEFLKRNVGHTVEVLFEKHLDKHLGCLKGVSRNYIKVFVESNDEAMLNSLHFVKIVDIKAGKVFGELQD